MDFEDTEEINGQYDFERRGKFMGVRGYPQFFDFGVRGTPTFFTENIDFSAKTQ